jgi:multimeric flavodoxin WrbA
MKILGIVASPRKEGNTEILVRTALDAAQKAGAEIDIFLVSGKDIAPCDACGGCEKTGLCIVKDAMTELYPKMLQADAIIFGTPVYFANVSAHAKIIMDRTYCLNRKGKQLKGKIGGAIVAVRRVGAGGVLSLMYSYFMAQGMTPAAGGIGFGREKGAVRQGVGGAHDSTALDEAQAVGRAVFRLTETVLKGRQ